MTGEEIHLASEELAEQLRESQSLLQISQMLADSLDLNVTLQHIVDAAVNLIGKSEQAVIHLLDEEDTSLHAVAIARPNDQKSTHRNNRRNVFRLGQGIAGLAIATGQTINVPDVTSDERFVDVERGASRFRALLVAPVKLVDKVIGTLSVQSDEKSAFSSKDERLLTTLGSQAAIAIDKAQLLKTEREARQLAEALREISAALSGSLNFDNVLDRLLEQMRLLIPYQSANIMLVDGGRTHMARMSGYEAYDEQIRQKAAHSSFDLTSMPYLNWMSETGQPCIVSNTQTDPKWVHLETSRSIGSWAGAPVLVQGQVVAFLSLNSEQPGFYKPEHIRRLTAFAGQAALVLQNAQLFHDLQQRLIESNILYWISQSLTQSLDLDVMLEQAVTTIQRSLGYTYVQVFLTDPQTDDLVLRKGSGHIGAQLKELGHRLKTGEGIVGHVAEIGRAFVTNDVESVPVFKYNPVLPATRAELAVPLKSGEKLLGVLDIQHETGKQFNDNDSRMMLTVADQLAVAIDNAILYADLQVSLKQEQTTRAQLVQSEKLAALGRIVASVAHELNNPLQAIQNALYLINLEEMPSLQTREDLRVAMNETTRMAELIARLRETYRPTTGEEFQPDNVNTVVTEVQKLIGTHLRHNNVLFKYTPDPNIPIIPMIRNQIKQVVLNICLNAVETMTDGGTLTVQTAFNAATNQVVLTFTDNGPGISDEILPYIFDPFVTTKEGGTGLGLAITYDIIQKHHGVVEVESTLGVGSTFTVLLPIRQPPPGK